MKKFKTVLLAMVILFSAVITFNAKYTSPAYARSPNDNEELSIALLHPHIANAITEFYGYDRRYEIGDSNLEILQRDGNIFTVKVTVDTFEGPHNDYYTEILTFTVTPSDITLENYTHSDFIQ